MKDAKVRKMKTCRSFIKVWGLERDTGGHGVEVLCIEKLRRGRGDVSGSAAVVFGKMDWIISKEFSEIQMLSHLETSPRWLPRRHFEKRKAFRSLCG